MEFELIAKTFMGLEPVLAQELRELGAKGVKEGRRMVSFTGDKEMMYRANFQLHTAIRILKPIRHFEARSADDVYNEVRKMAWEQYISQGKTFSVDSVVYSDDFTNSRFVTYRVKDAIADYFRENTGQRPNISVSNPDIQLHIHIAGNDASLSLDSSGESLHRRGYRRENVEAPLNEVLAAGMVLMTGWRGETDFIDPMCGSGTLLIEAGLIARNMAPGIFRKGYAFEKWDDFDADLFQEIYNDDSREREFEHHIYGYDNDPKAVCTALANVKAAGLMKNVDVRLQDFKDFRQPEAQAIMITNPPYGERLTTPDLLATYRMMGERLKHAFKGNEAWILSYKEECFQQIGLKPSLRLPLYNGSLECEFRKYQMFEGRLGDFRSEGGIVKTEEERRTMSEKPRQRRTTAMQRRMSEEEENEAGDIRSFTFYTLERQQQKRESAYGHSPRESSGNRERKGERGGRREYNKGGRDNRDGRDPKRYDKGGNDRRHDRGHSPKNGGKGHVGDRKENYNRRKQIFEDDED